MLKEIITMIDQAKSKKIATKILFVLLVFFIICGMRIFTASGQGKSWMKNSAMLCRRFPRTSPAARPGSIQVFPEILQPTLLPHPEKISIPGSIKKGAADKKRCPLCCIISSKRHPSDILRFSFYSASGVTFTMTGFFAFPAAVQESAFFGQILTHSPQRIHSALLGFFMGLTPILH